MGRRDHWRVLRRADFPVRARRTLCGFPNARCSDAGLERLRDQQVGEPKVVGQLEQVPPVVLVGPGKALLPAPDVDAIGFETPGDLRPRQAGLFLEPPQPLREVVGEIKGVSSVMNLLSRHDVAIPWNSSAAALVRPSVCAAFGSVCFRCTAYLGSGVIDPKSKLIR